MYGDSPADSELLARIRERDEDALRELFERHVGWLTLRLRRRTSSSDLAAEAVHETFLAVWRRPGAYRGDGDVPAWLWAIAIRRLISLMRHKAAPVPVAADVISAHSPLVQSAEEQLLVAVEHGEVGEALRALSPEMRQALQLTVIDGLSMREAAQLLHVPHGTVKSRVRLAKAHLRARLISVEEW